MPSVNTVKSSSNGNQGKSSVVFRGNIQGNLSAELKKDLTTAEYLNSDTLEVRKISDSIELNSQFVDDITKDCRIGSVLTWIFAPKGSTIGDNKTERGVFHSPSVYNQYSIKSSEFKERLEILCDVMDTRNKDVDLSKVINVS